MLALLPKPALDILRAPTLAYKLSQGIGTNQLYNKNTNHLIAVELPYRKRINRMAVKCPLHHHKVKSPISDHRKSGTIHIVKKPQPLSFASFKEL